LNFYQDFYTENQFRNYTISKNIGLKWPCYICSNDINYLNGFFENKREHVLELMSQNFSRKTTEAAYQVRCTVVGKEYFVGKIKSNSNCEIQAVCKDQLKYTIIQPPRAVRVKAIGIMTELNLTHGVFDFIINGKDEWFFESLNPIGQYQWTEDIKDSDISSSITNWLMANN